MDERTLDALRVVYADALEALEDPDARRYYGADLARLDARRELVVELVQELAGASRVGAIRLLHEEDA